MFRRQELVREEAKVAVAAQAEAKAKEVVEVVGAVAAAKQVRLGCTAWQAPAALLRGATMLQALWTKQWVAAWNRCPLPGHTVAGGGQRDGGGERPGGDAGTSCPGEGSCKEYFGLAVQQCICSWSCLTYD